MNTNQDKNNYKQIKLDMLAKYQISPVDIFINIGSKFVKIISSESNIIMAELKHYIAKDIEYVYIAKENFDSVLKEIADKIQRTKASIQVQKIEITANSYEYVKSKLQNLQMNEADIALINNATQSFIAELNMNPGPIKDKLAIFLSREDYLVNHALMTLFLYNQLIQKLGWHSEQTYLKVNYASMFSDIMLDNPFMAKIRRTTDPEFIQLSKDQKEMVMGHQAQAVEMLTNAGVIINDIESLILHHHELPDGTGFPRGLHADQISPLSCAFNLVSYFTQEYLNKDLNQLLGVKDIIENMDELFDKGNYKQPYKAFVKLIS